MAKSNFQTAVENTPEVRFAYQSGLQALKRNETGKIKSSDTTRIDGSLDIDGTVSSIYPNDNRWDYAIGYDGSVYYVEIHPAYTGEVDTVLGKLRWLKSWLNNRAPELKKLRSSYHWIQSGKCAILPGSKEEKKLASVGLKPKAIMNLK